MPNPFAPGRRYRSVLVSLCIAATACSGYMAYSIHWIHSRHLALDVGDNGGPMTQWGPSREPPKLLRWLGEVGVGELIAGRSATPQELARFRRLFPEATIRQRGDLLDPKAPSN